MDKIVAPIIEQIEKHGLLAVFGGSIVEEIIAPIPSPAIMMGSGFILLEQYKGFSPEMLFDLAKISIVGAVGGLIGSFVIYAIGYYGGKTMIEKTKRFTGVAWTNIEALRAKLDKGKSDELMIAGLRAIPVMPSALIALTCGAIRLNPVSYSIAFFSGGVVRNIVFVLIGWQFGETYKSFAGGLDTIQNIVTVCIAITIIAVFIWLYKNREKITG